VAAEPATLTGKVVSVHDGDTLRMLDAGGTQHKVRAAAASQSIATPRKTAWISSFLCSPFEICRSAIAVASSALNLGHRRPRLTARGWGLPLRFRETGSFACFSSRMEFPNCWDQVCPYGAFEI